MFNKDESRIESANWPETRSSQIVNVSVFSAMALYALSLSGTGAGKALLAVAFLFASLAVVSFVFLLKPRMFQSGKCDLPRGKRKLLRLAGLFSPVILIGCAFFYSLQFPQYRSYPARVSATAAHEVRVADAYFARRDFASAIVHYEAALQENANDGHSRLHAAAAYFIQYPSMQEKSLEYAHHPGAYDANSLAANYIVSASLVDSGRYRDALSTADYITSTYPDFAPGWVLLNQIYAAENIEYSTAQDAVRMRVSLENTHDPAANVLSALAHQ